jgi:hypothetical protein
MHPAMELRKIDVSSIQDIRGRISFTEFEGLDPLFSIKRFYYITQVPEAMSRGNHGHKKLQQLIFALSGSFNLRVTDGENSEEHTLSANDFGIFLGPGLWRELTSFSKNAVCLVLVSEKFDADDYISDYQDFLYWRKNESNPIL